MYSVYLFAKQITFLKDIFSEGYFKRLGLNDKQIKAVEYVKKNGRITNKEYQELNDASKKTASRNLSEIVNLNVLKSSGIPGAGAYYELR